jgi:hypothetical protein
MNRAIPHYQVLETNKDFPNWKVKVLTGDFTNITFQINKLGIPDNVDDTDGPVRVEIDYTITEGPDLEDGERVRFTQTVGWIVEDIVT